MAKLSIEQVNSVLRAIHFSRWNLWAECRLFGDGSGAVYNANSGKVYFSFSKHCTRDQFYSAACEWFFKETLDK